MKQVTAYQTTDGTLFLNLVDAEKYELDNGPAATVLKQLASMGHVLTPEQQGQITQTFLIGEDVEPTIPNTGYTPAGVAGSVSPSAPVAPPMSSPPTAPPMSAPAAPIASPMSSPPVAPPMATPATPPAAPAAPIAPPMSTPPVAPPMSAPATPPAAPSAGVSVPNFGTPPQTPVVQQPKPVSPDPTKYVPDTAPAAPATPAAPVDNVETSVGVPAMDLSKPSGPPMPSMGLVDTSVANSIASGG